MQWVPLKHWYPFTKLHSVILPLLFEKGITHKTSTLREKQKTYFYVMFLYIVNELYEITK